MKTRSFKVRALVIFGFAILVSSKILAQGKDCSAPVQTVEGPVQGLAAEKSAACVWKGIPYAAPPIGDLRFRPTRQALPRSGTLDAAQVGMSCMQKETITSGGKSRGFSEDCLTLNIWSPKTQDSLRLPVMVWFHGGGFQQGSGGYDIYNGARLAGEKNVVVVTINYRLGTLGFLSLPELRSEDPNGTTGNYGVLDQIQALKWVRANIKNFGGDPGNVTVFGQSAGGMSVCTLLVSPLADGLFQKAIPMSAPCEMFFSLEQGYEQGKAVTEAAGCAGPDLLKCLREKPVAQIMVKTKNKLLALGVSCAPHVDGYVLPDWPMKLIKAGKYSKAPIMLGNTKEELRLYTMMFSGIGLVPAHTVSALLRKLAPDHADEILAMYSYKDYRRPMDLFINVGNDMVFSGSAWQIAEAMSGKNPVYLYRVDWHDTNFPHKMGSFHGLDIPLVFGTLGANTFMVKAMANKRVLKQATPLSDQMMSYYTNFAKTGNPNGPGLADWPAYDPQKKSRIIFDNPIHLAPITDQELKRFHYFEQHPLSEIMAKGKAE